MPDIIILLAHNVQLLNFKLRSSCLAISGLEFEKDRSFSICSSSSGSSEAFIPHISSQCLTAKTHPSDHPTIRKEHNNGICVIHVNVVTHFAEGCFPHPVVVLRRQLPPHHHCRRNWGRHCHNSYRGYAMPCFDKYSNKSEHMSPNTCAQCCCKTP